MLQIYIYLHISNRCRNVFLNPFHILILTKTEIRNKNWSMKNRVEGRKKVENNKPTSLLNSFWEPLVSGFEPLIFIPSANINNKCQFRSHVSHMTSNMIKAEHCVTQCTFEWWNKQPITSQSDLTTANKVDVNKVDCPAPFFTATVAAACFRQRRREERSMLPEYTDWTIVASETR